MILFYENLKSKDNLKENIFSRYNLNSNNKCIILALPQLAEDNHLSWSDHLTEIQFLVQSLSSLGKYFIITSS